MNTIKKPKRLLLLGWGWLLFASLSLLDTVSDWAKIAEKKEQLQSLIHNPPPELANTVQLITPIYQNLSALLFLKFFLAVTAVTAAVNFLRLKKWSQKLLEALSWTMVLLCIVYIVFAVKFNASAAADGQSWQGLHSAILFMSLCSLPFLLSAWQLRSKTIAAVVQSTDDG